MCFMRSANGGYGHICCLESSLMELKLPDPKFLAFTRRKDPIIEAYLTANPIIEAWKK